MIDDAENTGQEREELARRIFEVAFRRRKQPPALENVRYNPAIVTFIDLLGFSNFIQDEGASARNVAQVLSLFYQTGGADYAGENIRVYIFSDSIVRVRELPSKLEPVERYQRSVLQSEFHALASIQFELACWYGLFLRGGVSYGPIFAEEGMIFGPALIDAYTLESQKAVYPRILIHPDVFRHLRFDKALWVRLSDREKKLWAGGEGPTDWDFTASAFQDVLVQDQDKNVFIDYMNANIKGADLGFVAAHRDAIVSSFSAANRPRIAEKYAWLAHFHNFTIRSDMNFEEIGLCEHRIEEFSVRDSRVLSLVSPQFKRIWQLDLTTESGFAEPS